MTYLEVAGEAGFGSPVGPTCSTAELIAGFDLFAAVALACNPHAKARTSDGSIDAASEPWGPDLVVRAVLQRGAAYLDVARVLRRGEHRDQSGVLG